MVVGEHTRFIILDNWVHEERRMGEHNSVIHMHQLDAGVVAKESMTFNTKHVGYCICNVVPLVLNFVHLVIRIGSEL